VYGTVSLKLAVFSCILYSADVASGSVSMETVLLVMIEFIDCGLRVSLSVLLYSYLS